MEVLRGPASSTLYGSGALGGTVNFTTKDASDFLEPGQTTAIRTKTSYESNGKRPPRLADLGAAHGRKHEFLFSGNYRQSDKIQTATGQSISDRTSIPGQVLPRSRITLRTTTNRSSASPTSNGRAT